MQLSHFLGDFLTTTSSEMRAYLHIVFMLSVGVQAAAQSQNTLSCFISELETILRPKQEGLCNF